MIERPLMTPDELKSMPRVISSSQDRRLSHADRLKLFLEWGITFGKPYEIAEKSARKVSTPTGGNWRKKSSGGTPL